MWREVNGIKVAVDELYQVFVNGELVATAVASPQDLDELALGLLYADGYIDTVEEVSELRGEGRKIIARIRRRASPSFKAVEDCDVVKGGRREVRLVEARLDVEKLRALVAEFGKFTMPTAEPSLAMHTSALLDEKGWLVVHDVSRHSSMLKLVGKALKEGRRGPLVFTTGRASSDLVARGAAIGASIMVSIRGPLNSGVETACALGVTLVANVRGRGLTPLCNPWRLKI